MTFKCIIPLLFSPSQRVTFKYNGSTIVPGDQGVDYETFKRKCTGKLRLDCFGTLPCLLAPYRVAGARGERTGENLGELELVLLLLPRLCPVLHDRVSSRRRVQLAEVRSPAGPLSHP